MPTPRSLDPKFNDENTTPEAEAAKPDVTPDVEAEDASKPAESDENMIVHRENYIGDDGQPTQRQHGPMPVSEWADYEKEHKL